MKIMKKSILTIFVCLLAFTLISCSKSSTDDITQEEVFEALQYFADTITPLEPDKEHIEEIEFDQTDSYLNLYSFTAPSTGTYSMSFTGYESVKDMGICVEIVDDYTNVLLDLYNTKNNNQGQVSLNGNITYYIVIYSLSTKKQPLKPFSISMKIEKIADSIECDPLEDTLTKNIPTNAYNTTYIEPKMDGFYDISIDSDYEYGESFIYKITENDEDLYQKDGLCWLEKGKRYYVIYGVETLETDQATINLQCNPIETAFAEEKNEISSNAVIEYTGKKEDDIVVYSVSTANPAVVVYDEDYKNIAQNKDFDGPYSKNKKDFATIFHTEEGKKYYIFVTGLEKENATIYFQSYE